MSIKLLNLVIKNSFTILFSHIARYLYIYDKINLTLRSLTLVDAQTQTNKKSISFTHTKLSI